LKGIYEWISLTDIQQCPPCFLRCLNVGNWCCFSAASWCNVTFSGK